MRAKNSSVINFSEMRVQSVAAKKLTNVIKTNNVKLLSTFKRTLHPHPLSSSYVTLIHGKLYVLNNLFNIFMINIGAK